ncbi:hypothetical protein HDU96_002856 [Phlyctochytrium bullatum]|nr:hypothetical protein HDU96_002856 [Phlyctochytrium bullatum]
MLKLQGSGDEKKQDFLNTTLMLHRNVKSPYTAMGKEEIRAEDEARAALFSTSSNIKTKGEWISTSRSSIGVANLKNDSEKYRHFICVVAFMVSVYLKVINELNRSYMKARGCNNLDDKNAEKECCVKNTLAEDFEFTPYTPFIAYRKAGVAIVRHLEDISTGESFAKDPNKSYLYRIIMETAKVLWRLAGLDRMNEDLVDWAGKYGRSRVSPKKHGADGGAELDSVTKFLGCVITSFNPLIQRESASEVDEIAVTGDEDSIAVNVDSVVEEDDQDVDEDSSPVNNATMEDAEGQDEEDEEDVGDIVQRIVQDPPITLEQAKEEPPATSLVKLPFTEIALSGKTSTKTTLEAEIAFTESEPEQKVIDLIFRDRGLRGDIRTLKQTNLSVFNIVRKALDTCFVFAEAEEAADDIGTSGDRSAKRDTAEIELSAAEKARAHFLTELEAAATGCRAIKWKLLKLGKQVKEHPPIKYVPMMANAKLTYFLVESDSKLYKIPLGETIRIGDAKHCVIRGVSDTRLDVVFNRPLKLPPEDAGIGFKMRAVKLGYLEGN